MSAFGVVALLLSGLGLYGVMSAAVRRQTRDIGVHVALGRQREMLESWYCAMTSLVLVGPCAAYFPARRAVRIDPVRALRSE